MQSKPFDILDRSLDIHRNYLVEASAGTGKTFSIENLYIRLLLESEKTRCSIDQILVVTFTRAATRELRARIRVNMANVLEQLNQSLQGSFKQKIPDYLQAVIDKGKDSVILAKRRIEQALFCFAEANIFTIHSFCQKMLKEHAFDLEIDHFTANSELLTSDQMRKVIRDFFRTGLSKESYSKVQLQIVLKKHRLEFEQVEEAILGLLNKGGSISKGPDFSQLFALFNEKLVHLKQIYCITSKKLIEDFVRQIPLYYGTCNRQRKILPNIMQQVDHFASLFEQDQLCESDFEKLLFDSFFLNLDPSKLRPKVSIDGNLHYPDLLATLHAEIHPLIQQAGSYSSIILRMAYDAQQLLNKYMSQEGKFQYDDLLRTMFQAVQKPEFAEKIRSYYQAAIIDEFQDTDSVQWEIFRKLFHQNCRLYLIGDPKQSIYGFRQADIYTYLEASRVINNGEKSSLSINYRSQPSLVKALNFLFSKNAGFIHLPRLGATLEYPLMSSSYLTPSKQFNDNWGSFHCCIAEAPQEKSHTWPTLETEKGFFFPFIAKEILKLNREDHIRLDQWAILVRDRYQADRLACYLKQQNISYTVQRQAYLTDSSVYPALRDLIYAILNPYDMNAIKQALCGRIIGWSHDRLLKLSEEEILINVTSQIFFLKSILIENGFTPFFYELMRTCWHDDGKTVQQRMLSQPFGIDIYKEMMQLAEVVMQQQNKSFSPEKILAFLEDLQKSELQGEERIKIRQDTGQDAVKIITLHSSKGLEFDIVFPLGIMNRTTKNESATLASKDAESLLAHYLEIDSEKMRLLYVAMTRAKSRLYLPIAISPGSFLELPHFLNLSPGEASPLELFLSHLGVTDIHSFLEMIKKEPEITYSHLQPEQAKLLEISYSKFEDVLVSPKQVTVPSRSIHAYSFTSISQGMQKTTEKDFPVTPPANFLNSIKTIHTLPAGSEAGKLLHLILEKISFSQVRKAESFQELVPIVKQYIQEPSFHGWEGVISEIIYNTLKTEFTLGQETFSFCEIEEDKCYREIQFLYPRLEVLQEIELPADFLKGVIDFVFEHKGRYYLVDWKSNWLGLSIENYSEISLEKAMQENHYNLQATIYVEAFKRYLKLHDMRPFEECFGGCFYLFLRGIHPSHPHSGIFSIISAQ